MGAAVDDRDNDVPVVLPGLCLSSSHHLFGLIECDRSAIVTDTFVNRHHSLPFMGAAQHAINSVPLGQSDSPNGRLWNIARSLHLDIGGLDHLAPLLGIVGDELAEVGR